MKKLVTLAAASAIGGAVAFTLCWALWGYLTPGDYFANGSSWLSPSLLAAAIAGGALGMHSRNRYAAAAWMLLLLASLTFWFLVPDGWWAHGPPDSQQTGQVGQLERCNDPPGSLGLIVRSGEAQSSLPGSEHTYKGVGVEDMTPAVAWDATGLST